MKTMISDSAKETQNLGRALAKRLRERETVALYGKLGSGKTCFTGGLAKALGITKPLTSPTFTFLKSYRFKRKGRFSDLYHFDFYRLRSAGELGETYFFEALEEKRRVIVIEWPEEIYKFLPRGCLKFHFYYGKKENQRKIRAPRDFNFAAKKLSPKR